MPTAASSYTDQERTEAAEETGRFFIRCLAGTRRGLSGRDRIKLANRVYILVRDIHGTVTTNPVRVFNSYATLKPHICQGPSFGDSVFAGFASQWEARAAVRAADYEWPN